MTSQSASSVSNVSLAARCRFAAFVRRTGALAGALLFFAGPGAAQPLQVRMDAAGRVSLASGGHEFAAEGVPRVTRVLFRDGAGGSAAGATQATVEAVPERREVTLRHAWGTVRLLYTPSGEKVDLAMTVTNTSTATLVGLELTPLVLQLPGRAREYDGNTPLVYHNVGGPTAIGLTWPAGSLALVNEDTVAPLLVGYPLAADRPANTRFPVLVGTGRSDLSDRLPLIDRPIAPGGTDEYRLSLRLSVPARPLVETAGDVYRRFAAGNGIRFGWTDRRPIAKLVFGTAATGYPTNPRGWFNDPAVDTITPEGVAAFRQRVLAWADESVRVMRSMNTQGMIVWDLEGEEFPHPITYVGDPRQIGALAPEMEGVVDEFFRRFTDAGFRVGVCVRPQLFVPPSDGQPARQVTAENPEQVLIEKIDYVKRRWGASLFYIDSNGDPSLPLPASILRGVAGAHPDVLLIPEHEDTLHWTIGAPYNELRGGWVSTPDTVRSAYPSAFSVIAVTDGPIAERERELAAAVTAGDILLFRGWYPDPEHEAIRAMLRLVPDSTPPNLQLVPVERTLTGTVRLAAEADDGMGLAGVRFQVDGVDVGPEDTMWPYAVSLATAALPNGVHTVTAVARDYAGNVTTSRQEVAVDNAARAECPHLETGRFAACYYDSTTMTEPKLVRTDDEIRFDWGEGAPADGVPNDFAARWRGVFPFSPGTYDLNLRADEGARVYVDGRMVVDRWRPGAETEPARITLDGGTHLVEVEYFDGSAAASVTFHWQRR